MNRFLSLLPLAWVCSIQAQDCSNGRYLTYDLFPTIDSVLAVPFGSNTGVGGSPQTLLMDVYMPAGDTLSARPVVVCGFGGSFVAGSRGDVAEWCKAMARLGYVAVAPDYRVGFFFPNQLNTARAVMRCTHDLRGCIRYLRRSKVELGDPYHIDPDRIIVGGVSAGAVGALHVCYLDEQAEILPVLYGDTASTGSIEGNSGSPGYSSDAIGCFSYSGALADTSWIHAGDQPLVSLHEVDDPVVQYGTEEVLVLNVATGLWASGSHDIHVRLDQLGIPNCFLSYPGSGHVGYLSYDPDRALDYVVQFCAGIVCNEPLNCGTQFSSVEEQQLNEAPTVLPNPANDMVIIRMKDCARCTLYDLSGREVLIIGMVNGQAVVPVFQLAPGTYVVRDKRGGKGTRLVITR